MNLDVTYSFHENLFLTVIDNESSCSTFSKILLFSRYSFLLALVKYSPEMNLDVLSERVAYFFVIKL